MFHLNRSISLATGLVVLALGSCTQQSVTVQTSPTSEPPVSQTVTESISATPPPRQISQNAPAASPSPEPRQNRLKVFFPKMPESGNDFSYVEPVWRSTPQETVANFAISELIKGPTSQEQQLGLIKPITLKGDSNCSSDFAITINQKVAQLKFCRQVVSAGIGDDARITSSIQSTLKQFSTIDSVVIVDRQGNCFGDSSGDNRCLADRPQNPRGFSTATPLTLTGIGALEIGMSIAEAEQATGIKLKQQASGGEEGGCFYYVPEGGPEGLSFMVTDTKITRIDIDTKSIKTVSGATIGDTEARIRQLYPGQIQSEPHHYVEGGKYLIFIPKDLDNKNYRVIFETNAQGIVTRFRSGQLPEVSYIEGCA